MWSIFFPSLAAILFICISQHVNGSSDFIPPPIAPIKSSLKSVETSASIATTIKKGVTFSDDTKESSPSSSIKKPSKLKTLKQCIKFIYKNYEPISQIFPEKPFDYEVEAQEGENDWNRSEFIRSEFGILIDSFYPGIMGVPITIDEMAGLVVLATFHSKPSGLLELDELSCFKKSFEKAFSDSSKLLSHYLDAFSESIDKIDKVEILGKLVSIAYNNSLFYTIEAFHVVFESVTSKIFIKQSIKTMNHKIFQRLIGFNGGKNGINPDRIVLWAIQYGNVQVYLDFIDFISSTEKVVAIFRKSIINYASKITNYFPGLVDKFAQYEMDSLDEALLDTIRQSNVLMFKELIKYDNSYFPSSFNPVILSALRELFCGHSNSFGIHQFELASDFYRVCRIIVKMNSSEEFIISAFRSAVSGMSNLEDLNFFAIDSLLFVKEKERGAEYLKILYTAENSLAPLTVTLTDVSFVSDGDVVGIWEYIRDAKESSGIMNIISNSPRFSILHAIANPNFPAALWPQMIDRYNQMKCAEGEREDYRTMALKYGFFLESLAFYQEGANTRSGWSLLDLAVLNFNLTAVKMLLRVLKYDAEEIESALILAQVMRIAQREPETRSNVFLSRFIVIAGVHRQSRKTNSSFFKSNGSIVSPLADYFYNQERITDEMLLELQIELELKLE